MKDRIEFPVSSRPFSRLAAVFLCLAAAMPFVALNSVQASSSFLEFSASAYGTYAFVGSTIVVGQTAPVSVGSGCGTAAVGVTHSGTVASVTALPAIQTGAINTSAASTTNSATATSDVHDIFLLGATKLAALIAADEVKAVSTTSQDNTGFHVSAAGSNLVNLRVGTTVFNAVPAPNTTLLLLNGAVKVVLNEQIVSNSSSSSMRGLTVNMIHVYVTADVIINNTTIKAGTQIIVAHAVSHLTQIGGPGSLDGTAFGTSVSSAIIKSSQTAPASVGCQGNALIPKTQVGINVPNVLSSGTIQDTAQGSVTNSLSSAQTTSTVQSVNLLNGTIRADVVSDQANASTSPPGTTFNFSQSGSFVSLLVTVNGVTTDYTNAGANTTVALSGIGTLYLHRVIQNTNSITVRMIELVLAKGNVLGLPTGMDIIVCSSSASLHNTAHP
jgi:hypothetical protein